MKDGKIAENGTIYYNTGGINYSTSAKGKWFSRVFPKKHRKIYTAIVKVEKDMLTISTYNIETGEIIDEFKVKK